MGSYDAERDLNQIRDGASSHSETQLDFWMGKSAPTKQCYQERSKAGVEMMKFKARIPDFNQE